MTTSTLEINGFKITLPIGLPEVLDTPVRDSYQTFLRTSDNDVRRHLTCATTLLPPQMMGRDHYEILHAFGGLGATAQILDQCVTNLKHTFWERDPVCVKYLQENYPDHDVQLVADSFKRLQETDLSEFDILLLDMSVGTIKTPTIKPMWAKVSKWFDDNADSFVWFTDTACHKMHLNHKTYEKDFGIAVGPTAESYLTAYSIWLERTYGLTIHTSMREAGEFYNIVKPLPARRFQSIPYV